MHDAVMVAGWCAIGSTLAILVVASAASVLMMYCEKRCANLRNHE